MLAKMRAAVSTHLLPYKAYLSREVSPGTDEWGQPIPTPEAGLAYHPSNPIDCDFVVKTTTGDTQGQNITNDHSVFDNYYQLVVPFGSDVLLTDRVDEIRDELGNVINSPLPTTRYRITDIATHETHKTLVLEVIK